MNVTVVVCDCALMRLRRSSGWKLQCEYPCERSAPPNGQPPTHRGRSDQQQCRFAATGGAERNDSRRLAHRQPPIHFNSVIPQSEAATFAKSELPGRWRSVPGAEPVGCFIGCLGEHCVATTAVELQLLLPPLPHSSDLLDALGKKCHFCGESAFSLAAGFQRKKAWNENGKFEASTFWKTLRDGLIDAPIEAARRGISLSHYE